MLGRRRRELGVAVVLAEEDDRQLPDGGQVHGLVERALGGGAVAEERHRDATVRRGAGTRRPRPRRSARRRRRSRWRRRSRARGSAMCIDPPRPRLVPWSLPISSANIAERVEALGQAVAVAPVGRGDDVGRAERPAGADRRRLLPDREVDEAGNLAVAVERRTPVPRSRGSPASGGTSRRGRPAGAPDGGDGSVGHGSVVYWSVQMSTRTMCRSHRHARDPRRGRA